MSWSTSISCLSSSCQNGPDLRRDYDPYILDAGVERIDKVRMDLIYEGITTLQDPPSSTD